MKDAVMMRGYEISIKKLSHKVVFFHHAAYHSAINYSNGNPPHAKFGGFVGMKMVAIALNLTIMDVIIQSLGFKAGEELENYIREKLQKLTPSDKIIRANVALFLGPDRATPNTYCEIRLEVPGPDLFIKESAVEFEQAVDECVNKLQGQLRKAKEKQVERWQGKVNE